MRTVLCLHMNSLLSFVKKPDDEWELRYIIPRNEVRQSSFEPLTIFLSKKINGVGEGGGVEWRRSGEEKGFKR